MPVDRQLLEQLAREREQLDADESYAPEGFSFEPQEDNEKQPASTKRFRRRLLHSVRIPTPEDVIEDCDDEERMNSTATDINEVPSGCVTVDSIAEDFRSIFPYPFFNRAQSACFDTAYHSDDNMVVSAPTSTGKTVIMELAIVHLMMKGMKGGCLQNRKQGAAKVVYMAPIKALCQQMSNNWRKFEELGIHCVELTGDSEDLEYGQLIKCDIILTTPEKWDSVTRKWKDNKAIIGQIALMLIDEVHLLNEDRGATLEAVVSRMNTVRLFESMEDCPSASLRFIALSATIPNMVDICDWLNVPEAGRKCFGQEFRPVKLDIKVIGYPNCKNEFLFDNNLNFKLFELIKSHSAGKPSLVFCSTRKGTIAAANEISKEADRAGRGAINPLIKDRNHKQRLLDASQRTTDKALAECIKAGVGFHTAGMQHSDRSLIENLFLAGDLTALCATSSLAQGVNFPAHLVIIKSTQFYKKGAGYVEHNEMTIMQMIGRAGRPQFDNSAVAIIMTRTDTKSKWDNILHGTQPIESNLLGHLTEHLNSEIVLKTITDISMAIKWLKSTYLFKRIARNPSHYGIPASLMGEKLDKHLKDILLRSLHNLAECNLIAIDEDGFDVRPLEAGICMARFFIEFSTMKQFTQIEPNASLESLICVLSKSQELSPIILRQEEKKKLYEVSKHESFRFPLDGKIKSSDMKVNCLIQGTLGNIPIEDWGLRQDSQHLFMSATRLMRGMVHFLAERRCYIALKNAIILHKCLDQKMWENSPLVLKQLDKIGPVHAGNLHNNGITTFQKLAETDPRRIESILGRHIPFGNEVKQSVASIPKFGLRMEQVDKTDTGARLMVFVTRLNEPKVSAYNCWHLIVGDADNNMLYYKKIRTTSTNEVREYVDVPHPKSQNREVTAHLLNDEYIGIDVKYTITPGFNPQPPPELLPFQQVPGADNDDGWLDKAYMEYEETTQLLPDFEEVPDAVIVMTPAPITQKNLQPLNPKSSTPGTQSQTTECKHACKDKSKCKHECCKHGIKAAKKSLKRPHGDDDIIDLTGPSSTKNKNQHISLVPNTTSSPAPPAKRSKIVPLTTFFKPIARAPEREQEQVVPNVDTQLDPSWFDEPVILPASNSSFLSTSLDEEQIFTFVNPDLHPTMARLPKPDAYRTLTPQSPQLNKTQPQPKLQNLIPQPNVPQSSPSQISPPRRSFAQMFGAQTSNTATGNSDFENDFPPNGHSNTTSLNSKSNSSNINRVTNSPNTRFGAFGTSQLNNPSNDQENTPPRRPFNSSKPSNGQFDAPGESSFEESPKAHNAPKTPLMKPLNSRITSNARNVPKTPPVNRFDVLGTSADTSSNDRYVPNNPATRPAINRHDVLGTHSNSVNNRFTTSHQPAALGTPNPAPKLNNATRFEYSNSGLDPPSAKPTHTFRYYPSTLPSTRGNNSTKPLAEPDYTRQSPVTSRTTNNANFDATSLDDDDIMFYATYFENN